MKLRLLLTSLLGVFAVNLHAAELERIVQSHLSLDAALDSNASSSTDHFKTDYGSSDVHTEKSRSIGFNVRNFGKVPAQAELEIYWIGKFTGGNTRVLLRQQTTKIDLAAGGQQRGLSRSGDVLGSDLKLIMIGVRHTEGFKIEGWVAKLYSAATDATGSRQLLAIKAGDTHLEEFARTPGAIAALPLGKTHDVYERLGLATPSEPAPRAQRPIAPAAVQPVAKPAPVFLPAKAIAFTVTELTDAGFLGRTEGGELLRVRTTAPFAVGEKVTMNLQGTALSTDEKGRKIIDCQQMK